jgi:hypothetical protein
MTLRFRQDNTEGYDQESLDDLNTAWTQVTSHGSHGDDLAAKSMLDYWAEILLAAYDEGKRGTDLLVWFYAP